MEVAQARNLEVCVQVVAQLERALQEAQEVVVLVQELLGLEKQTVEKVVMVQEGATAGGTGNPGGDSGGVNGLTGGTGTGGCLIVICEGTLSGTGTITANGVDGVRPPGSMAGGGSGGGSATVLYKTDSSSITPTATGGAGQFSGDGGAGTARKLAIGAN